jgi:hypothetical protein
MRGVVVETDCDGVVVDAMDLSLPVLVAAETFSPSSRLKSGPFSLCWRLVLFCVWSGIVDWWGLVHGWVTGGEVDWWGGRRLVVVWFYS